MIKFNNYQLLIGSHALITNLSLTLKRNSFNAFVIGSSCGKTMLFKDLAAKIISGNDQISIKLNNKKVLLIPTNLDYFFDKAILTFIKKQLGLKKLLFKYHLSDLDKLSYFEQCKLLLIYIAIYKPSLIVLDNTFLECNNRELLYLFSELKKLQIDHKSTVLYLTEKMNTAYYFDKIGLFANNQLILYGDKKLVINEIIDKNIFIDLPFYVALSHHLMFYDMLDQLYFTNKQIAEELWK